jgi:uncharacterized protein (UPF0548 family)
LVRSLHRLTPAAADRLRDLPLTYEAVGATLRGETPDGFRPLSHRVRLGRGPVLFDRASAAVLSWQLQTRAGLGVRASSATVGPDTVAELRLLVLRAPVRVVGVVDEPGRRGFAYGTLPGHPERGEEQFVVAYEDDVVTLEITAFSRPSGVLARLPLARTVQAWVTRRYGRALGG